MAGSYPDAFGRRMAWDVDGTVAFWMPDNGLAQELSSGQMAAINDEEGGTDTVVGGGGIFGYYVHIFPELRDIKGYFIAGAANGDGGFSTLETSVDTTNGVDGTWVQQVVNITDSVTVRPDYRNAVDQVSAVGIKGIRVYKNSLTGFDDRIQAIHIYGNIASGQTPDRIQFLDTLNLDAVFTKVLDFGDVPRGQTQTRTFKIKNNSATLTVNTINVTAEDLYLNAGDWFTFGDDNIVYAATFAVGNLGPGAEKLLYMKQIVPVAETLGLQTGRIKVTHASVT